MTALCRLDELNDPGARAVDATLNDERVSIILVRKADAVFAYRNSCPHTGAPLNWQPDRFLTPDRRHIQCALHLALFEIDTGRCFDGPPEGQALEAVPVGIENGTVVLKTT